MTAEKMVLQQAEASPMGSPKSISQINFPFEIRDVIIKQNIKRPLMKKGFTQAKNINPRTNETLHI